MTTRSWLANAKSVHDLGNHFYVPRSKHDWRLKREDRAEDLWLQRLRKPIPVAEKYRHFFGSYMHDSWVMGVERTPQLIRVTLDSINADIFAIALADILVVDRARRQWPVDLQFHDPVYMRAARHTHTSGLRFSDVRLLRSDEPQEGPQFLHDWFFDEDDRIQWISEIWDPLTRADVSLSVYLMIDCHRVSAADRRLPALESAFGPVVRPLWEDALAGVDAEDIWHMVGMETYLRRRMRHHGFRRVDFDV